MGPDLFWWLSVTGAIRVPATRRIGRDLRVLDPVIGTPRARLVRAGVRFHPGATAARGRAVTFADGTDLSPDAVLWAAGHRHDDRWIAVPAALEAARALITDQDHTPVTGLYTWGRTWQRTRGSALLGVVGADARRLVEEITGGPPCPGVTNDPDRAITASRRRARSRAGDRPTFPLYKCSDSLTSHEG